MATYIYVPASDEGIADSLKTLEAVLDRDSPQMVKSGTRALKDASSEASRLYILGHGNWGAGIGTHRTHYGAGSLSRMLIAEGLSAQQISLEVHLYACNTGVSGTRVIGTRRPFALRFGEALATRGFSNTLVIGYVGFMSPTLGLYAQQKGGENSGARTAIPTKSTSKTAPGDRRVVFTVHAGKCSQVGTETWGMRSTLAWRTVNVVRTDTPAKA